FFSVSALCGTLDRRAIEREGESSLYQNNVTLSLGYMFR
ncbi:PorT family protein, partial [Parabacteroides merdae]